MGAFPTTLREKIVPAWIRLPVRVTSGLSLVTSAGSATKVEQPPKKMEEANREERRSVFLLVIYSIYQRTWLNSLTFGICLGIVKLMSSNLLKHSPISEISLRELYLMQKKSLSEIAFILNVSVHKVRYWMEKYKIMTRCISDAAYLKHNPGGEPFKIKVDLTLEEEKSKSLALGLYWGEGNKVSSHAVRVTNSDPGVINRFHEFLLTICQVRTDKIGYYLQTFKDNDVDNAKRYWANYLGINPEKILAGKPIHSLGKGTYKKICEHGVMTIGFFNTHLKAWIMRQLGELGMVR